MTFNQALAITLDEADLELLFGKDIFHPTKTEKRYLKDIRNSLLDKQAVGPELLYTIAMDVGKKEHQEDLIKRNLLYGVVGYNNGVIGNELVRSQGHIHAISASCHSSTPEVYEIWQGKAYIYMQEFVDDQPGRCIVVFAKPGDIVIVPPNWAHYTVNASQDKKMLFGAWCIRDYAFEYKEIRQRQGLAYYPVIENSHIKWRKNTHYAANLLETKTARAYPEFKLSQNNLYTQYEEDSERFDFVTNPLKVSKRLDGFSAVERMIKVQAAITRFNCQGPNFEGTDIKHNQTKLENCIQSYQQTSHDLDLSQVIYEVEYHENGLQEGHEGGLFLGISHVMPGTVGQEFYMTKGHLHQEKDTGEYYWGLAGQGLLLLVFEDDRYELQEVTAGSVHYIPGKTSHRLINIGSEKLSVGACWLTVSGHDYDNCYFPIRVFKKGEGKFEVINCTS